MAGTKQIRIGKVIRFKKDLEIQLGVWEKALEQEETERMKDYTKGFIHALESTITALEEEFDLIEKEDGQ